MKNESRGVQALVTIFFVVLCALVIIPFILLVSISLTSELEISRLGYRLWPQTVNTTAYGLIFANTGRLVQAYKVTILVSFATMAASTFLQALIAYPLSRPGFRARRWISFYLYFTGLFNGGLVPAYILNTQYLHLQNTYWIYILPALVSAMNVFMIRTFFQSLPNEIFESASIDGASEYRMLLTFAIPLSKPVLATVALMTFLAKWNDWTTSMYYINDKSMVTLQYLLQMMMRESEQLLELMQSGLASVDMADQLLPAESTRMAMAVCAAGPALLVFPFFQKYFTKGLTIGSVKG